MNQNAFVNMLRRPSVVSAFIIVGFILAVFLAFMHSSQANAAFGSGGDGTSGGGGGYYTYNGGFGWKLFSKNGSGPSAGFRDGSTRWSSVQQECSQYSGSGVWVHVVRNRRDNSSGEMGYNYGGSTYNRDRPVSGGDPWMYNANGDFSPQGAAGSRHVIEIVASVRARFEVEHSAYVRNHWGIDVAWFCDGRKDNWSSTGTTTVNQTTAAPGDTVRWIHTLTNNGPTTASIYSQTVNSGFVGDTRFNGTHNGYRGSMNSGSTRSPTDYRTYTVTQADVGSTLCQQLQWDPTNSTGGRNGRASNACVSVPYNYTLRPEIRNITDGRVVESNDIPFNVPGRITNDGDTRSRPSVNWQITQIEYAPSMALSSIPNRSGGSGSNDSPCRYYTSPQRTSCRGIASANDTNSIPYPGNLAVNGSSNLANKPAGTKICFALSVWPYRQSDSNVWRHSPLVCLIIGKKPKVQVLSGDLMVGRASASNTGNIADVVTSTSENARRYYGSWAEYAIIPSGCVAGMASGSGYVGGAGSDVMSGLSILTFTNPSRNISGQSACPGGVGRYTHTSNAPNVAARFPIQTRAADATPTRPANPAVLPSTTIDFNSTSPTLSGHYQAPAGATNLTINGGTINAGRWVVISAPNSVVTIANNIQYTNSPLANMNEIPQVVIIARDIIIEDDVERIDAWLVAVGTDVRNGAGAITQRRGTINTCGGGSPGITTTSNLTISTCDRRLTVNGPVVANHLVLRRTAGSGPGTATGEPAEVFNLRADAYMWATSYNVASGRLSTVDTKELPPRF